MVEPIDTTLDACWHPSLNHGERVGGRQPDMLILHYTAMKSAQAAIDWLTDERSQVSAHYLIDEDGHITQMVPECRRAWHAGAANWHGETDINSCSIGIEIHNLGHACGCPPYPDPQMAAVAALSADIVKRHGIEPERVLAHSDVAPKRKMDPGEHFNWAYLAQSGVGLWQHGHEPQGDDGYGVGDQGADVQGLKNQFRNFGYGLRETDCFDTETEQVVAAFQRHWRQSHIDGRADQSTRSVLEALLAKLSAK